MKITIIGCGRVGVELALSLYRNHSVTIVDNDPRSFDRLGADFIGRTVEGEGLDRSVLQRAGIASANALAAVTSSDNVNVVVGRIARDLYQVPRVAVRVYNPRRIPLYERFGLQTVSSSTWGAHRIEQLLVHPGVQSVFSAGNGEVQLYEVSVSNEWVQQPLRDLLPAQGAVAMSLVRCGKATLPDLDSVLQPQDILHISATADGIAVLRQRLHDNGNGNGSGKQKE
jgi:trk system potassium uptake protein TrkA